MFSSLKSAASSLARAPVFSATAVLIMALGVGLSATVFSLMNAALFRPLPLPESDRLVALLRTAPESKSQSHAPASFLQLRDGAKSFSGLSAWYASSENVSSSGRLPEAATCLNVSANFLGVLRLAPFIGNGFTSDEDQPGRGQVVLLTHRYWQSRFAGDPAVVGQPLKVGSEMKIVGGVLPPSFDTAENWRKVDVVRALTIWASFDTMWKSRWFGIIGRLKDGVEMGEARAEVSSLAARMAHDHPFENGRTGIRTVGLASSTVPDNDRQTYWLMVVFAVFVLVIGCANLASAQLARALGRSGEFAIRQALGASRWDLTKPLLAEGVLLAVAGCGLGLLFARWANAAVEQLRPGNVPVEMDARVVIFATGLSTLTALLFGLAPAWLSTQSAGAVSLNALSRGNTTAPSQKRWKKALVVGQLALACILVNVALNLAGALRLALSRDLGWQREHLVYGSLNLPAQDYPDAATRVRFTEFLHERVGALTGVEQMSIASWAPIYDYFTREKVLVEGHAPLPEGQEDLALTNGVDHEFFSALGIKFHEGGGFPESIRPDSPPVVIVNEALARRYWPSQSAIGRRIRFHPTAPWAEIVGVVSSVQMAANFEKPASPLQVYLPLSHYPAAHCAFILRTSHPQASLSQGVRAAIRDINGAITISQLGPIDGILQTSLAHHDFPVLALSVFAVAGLLIALVGLYGVMDQFTRQSEREIGVRIALGATSGGIMLHALGQAGRLIAPGLVLGLAGSWLLMLYHQRVSPELPLPHYGWQFALVGGLCATGLLTVLVPSLRASRTDPVIVLRSSP